MWAASRRDGEGKCRSALYQNLHAFGGAREENSRASRSTAEREWLEWSYARPPARSSERRDLFFDTICSASDSPARGGLSVWARSYQCQVHASDGTNTWHAYSQHDAFAEACKEKICFAVSIIANNFLISGTTLSLQLRWQLFSFYTAPLQYAEEIRDLLRKLFAGATGIWGVANIDTSFGLQLSEYSLRRDFWVLCEPFELLL